jgi:hypothetical protein
VSTISSTRPGDRALLRHVPDEDHDDVALLREPRELRRAFAHLRHAARRGRESFRVRGLDRVDHHDFGRFRRDRRDDRFELHLGQHRYRRIDETEPLRAERHLLDRFLARDVERLFRGADRGHRLQEQRRLADARIAAQQDDPARHQSASSAHGRIPRGRWESAALLRVDGGERPHARRFPPPSERVAGGVARFR